MTKELFAGRQNDVIKNTKTKGAGAMVRKTLLFKAEKKAAKRDKIITLPAGFKGIFRGVMFFEVKETNKRNTAEYAAACEKCIMKEYDCDAYRPMGECNPGMRKDGKQVFFKRIRNPISKFLLKLKMKKSPENVVKF